MKNVPLAIAYFLIASVLGAVGQFFYKAGAERVSGSAGSYLLNPWIALGAVCYVGVMVLFVSAFRHYPSPSTLYPVYAATFVWAVLIDHAAYGRTILPANVGGMILLILGMYLIGRQP